MKSLASHRSLLAFTKRIANALILLLCLLPALSFVPLGHFNRPARDDFRFIGTYADKPFWEALQQALQGLSNDFSVGYSFLTVKIILDPLGYSIVQIFPALVLTVLFFCITALLVEVLNALGLVANKRLIALAVGGLLLSAIYGGLATYQGLYYFETTVKYSLSIAPMVLYTLLLLHVMSQPCVRGRSRIMYVLVGWALCFVATGFSETFDIVILLTLLLLLALTLLLGDKWRQRWLSILASGIAANVTGILLILSSPGLQARVARRSVRPGIADRSIEEILTQTVHAYPERIGDPDGLASMVLMLAVGFLVGLALPKAHYRDAEERPGRITLKPLQIALVMQLLLLPLIWQHTSDQPLLFGRYSAAYTYVITINLLLILGAAWLLYKQRRAASGSETVAKAAAYAGLVGILLCFAPTQLRDMHWRAYWYLWLSAHSLLIMLGWQVSRWLSADHVRRFAISLGCLYFLILVGTAFVALATNLLSVNDIARTYTFLAHLFAWLGLVWGLALGWAFASIIGSRKLLAVGALLVAIWLSTPIVVENVAMLPRWRQYSIEFDDRLATILELRATGQRDFIFAPYSFDLTKHLRIGPMHEDQHFMWRYDINSIMLSEA